MSRRSSQHTWSVLAHLSVFVNLLTGFLGPVVALIIWFVYRDRSERVSFHALQSALYQLGWAVILAVGRTITALLTVIIVGLVLIPVMLVLSVVPFVHMAYAAYKVRGWTTAIPSWRTSSGAAAGAVLYRRTKVGIPGDPH